MLTRYAVKKSNTGDQILEKLRMAIEFVNTFGDEPCINREDFFNDRSQLPYKLTQAVWPG